MRIVGKSPARMHARHRPWVAWGATAILLGGAFWNVAFDEPDLVDWAIYVPVTIGMIGVAWWFMPAVDVVFDRAAGLVTVTERRLTGASVRHFPLAKVRRVSLRYERHRSMSPRLNRLVLEVGSDAVALERGFGPRDRTAIATDINRWLDPDDPAPVEPTPRPLSRTR